MKFLNIKNEPIDHAVKRPRWRRGTQWSNAEIDTSDIPPLSENFFATAKMGAYRVAAQHGATVHIRWDVAHRLNGRLREAIGKILNRRR